MENTRIGLESVGGFIEEYRPPPKFHFRVDFPMIAPLGYGFQEVSGMGVSWSYESLEEGGVNTFSHKLLNKLSYEDLTLKRGIVNMASPLVIWLNGFMNLGVNGISATTLGGVHVSNVATPITVTLLDDMRLPMMVWSFVEAIPISWTFDTLDALDDGGIFIEEMKFTYSYLTRIL